MLRLTETHLTFRSFSTNVQFAWANSAGLNSVVDKLAELRFEANGGAGGFPSIEISLARHFEPCFIRRRLFPLQIVNNSRRQ